ncbi:MAG: M15 family metallopeptidase [Oscillospiraceae bacterium]|nr:M15 family metallopeptidase [Oscillospiraceae bacterium]
MTSEDLRTKIGPWLRTVIVFSLLAAVLLCGLRILSWNTLGQSSSRLLTLVNAWNPTSETGYSVRLTGVEANLQADRACASALKKMLADCREAGCRPLLLSAYRSVDDQLVLFDETVQDRIDQGLSPAEAEDAVARLIARPGRSEHELGLAFDIVDEDHPLRDETQAATPTAVWLSENSWRYGFVLRYPEGTEEITGYSWHPWHYRYVGEDVAENLYTLGITLEEYLSLFYSEEAAVVYDEKS